MKNIFYKIKKSVDSISKEITILLRDTIEESVKFRYSKYGWLYITHLSNSTVTCNMRIMLYKWQKKSQLTGNAILTFAYGFVSKVFSSQQKINNVHDKRNIC